MRRTRPANERVSGSGATSHSRTTRNIACVQTTTTAAPPISQPRSRAQWYVAAHADTAIAPVTTPPHRSSESGPRTATFASSLPRPPIFQNSLQRCVLIGCSTNAPSDLILAQTLETTTGADPSTLTISNQPRGNEVLISTLKGRSLESLGIKCVLYCYESLHVLNTCQAWGPYVCHVQGTNRTCSIG